jgi:hypothetical protein
VGDDWIILAPLSWIKEHQWGINTTLKSLLGIELFRKEVQVKQKRSTQLHTVTIEGAHCSIHRVIEFVIYSALMFSHIGDSLSKSTKNKLIVKITCDGVTVGNTHRVTVAIQIFGIGLKPHCLYNVCTVGIFSCAESKINYKTILAVITATLVYEFSVENFNFTVEYITCTDLVTKQYITVGQKVTLRSHFCGYCDIHYNERSECGKELESWQSYLLGDKTWNPFSTFIFCALHCDMRVTAKLLVATYYCFVDMNLGNFTFLII